MKKTVRVKNVTIGEGTPKICVPMVGETVEQLVEEAKFLRTIDLDVIEWRVDFFKNVENFSKVIEALNEIQSIIPEIPLLFTFRTAKEGGERQITPEAYKALYIEVMETRMVDIIDLELFSLENDLKELIEMAHSHHIFVVLSNHDFLKTPSKKEILSRLRKAQELGGDLPKIAVMPKHPRDVLTLLEATMEMNENYADRPIITMSMAGKGMVTRIAGEVFGSALTFGAAKKTSAPGQLPVSQLREFLALMHRGL
ncbi:type I 3-dehydroquinate dehydratase [Mesobacillus maritimus]|uniref:3-dehydroquinate dehydratase n=1 Tax=Mesobacillus maritimus TaxID=1643336 RepID=A0ABS7K936_9BACI|nr:type I 3-dehydroquinate dehydratase [Mesobacillus maritimus]MBY0098723.1 type I 3-dehydroquinate dehydratase [Mesobacillus maritimus]